MTARVALAGYVLLAVGNVIAVSAGATVAEWITKPLLMPVLIFFVAAVGAASRPTGRLLLGGLVSAWIADVALLFDSTAGFLTGMAFFGVMQVCYIVAFIHFGAWGRLRAQWWIPGGYAAFLVTFHLVMWPGFAELTAAIAGYSLLLVAMAAAAAGVARLIAAGAALFLISDLMIGFGAAGTEFAGQSPAIMATYTTAQLLIVVTWAKRLDDVESPNHRLVAVAAQGRTGA